jgi:hypothetical protein
MTQLITQLVVTRTTKSNGCVAKRVMRGSLRDNVLMGQTYDAEFMGEVGACYAALLHYGNNCNNNVTCVSGYGLTVSE